MIDQSKLGSDWEAYEQDVIVSAYFEMLEAELAGQPYVKRHFAKTVMQATGRSLGSIEFKNMNLSAVVSELGLPRIHGYKPRENYQDSLIEAVGRFLDAHPTAWNLGHVSSAFENKGVADAPASDFNSPWGTSSENGLKPKPKSSGYWLAVGEPLGIIPLTDRPPNREARKPRPEGRERIVRKLDPAGRDHRNRVLGLMGEERVLYHERAYLIAHDRADLVKRIEWTSQERGDGAGYDIKSFDPTGKERLIEVKATRGGPMTDFFLTRTELEVANERPDVWRLYRVHDLVTEPGLFQMKPPLTNHLNLQPESWRAYFY